MNLPLIGYWLLVIGYWLLVIGYWLLVIGYWLLVIGGPLSIKCKIDLTQVAKAHLITLRGLFTNRSQHHLRKVYFTFYTEGSPNNQ
jgi:hypothetical protein